MKHRRLRQLTKSEHGFTVIELIIVIGVSAVFVAIISFFGFNYWRYAFQLQSDQDTFVDRLNAGDFVRENLGTASGLISENSIQDANVTNSDPVDGPNYWLTIHAIPGNTAMPASGSTTPLVYFKRFSTNSSGTFIMNGSTPYEDEYVLYLDGTTKELRQRALANPSASGNKLETSCPPAIATAACPADKVLAHNIASVDTRYFSRTGNLLDWTSLYDTDTNTYIGPDFPAVEVVEFTLNISAKAALTPGNSTINSTIIRIALRNG